MAYNNINCPKCGSENCFVDQDKDIIYLSCQDCGYNDFQPVEKNAEEWPKDYKNPSKQYLGIEENFKRYDNEKSYLAMKIWKGFRLSREEYSKAVEDHLIIGEDTDESYKKFMETWKETEKQFGYFSR